MNFQSLQNSQKSRIKSLFYILTSFLLLFMICNFAYHGFTSSKLIFSTYFGGTGNDTASFIVIDNHENIVVAGNTNSSDIPAKNPYQEKKFGSCTYGGKLFITKFNSLLTSVIFSTYLGGSSTDYLKGVAVDNGGNIYILGNTKSNDFPTKNAFQKSIGGNRDVFITKISSSGKHLIYSTYLGGCKDEYAGGITVDDLGNVYVSGFTESENFPTKNAFQKVYDGKRDSFVAKLDSTGKFLVYSTFLGGSKREMAPKISIDKNKCAYVSGSTESSDFPTINSYQPKYQEVYITKFNQSGTKLIYSTFLGGSGKEFPTDIVVDKKGDVYITGFTESTDFPTKNAYQKTKNGPSDVFLTKILSSGKKIAYSTYLGGSKSEYNLKIRIDRFCDVYIIGTTVSTDFPTKNAFLPSYSGRQDGFITKFHTLGNSIIFSTYIGGSYVDSVGDIVVDRDMNVIATGSTSSTDFPIKNAYQDTLNINIKSRFKRMINFGKTEYSNKTFDIFIIKLGLVTGQ